jgi:fused signal recognition particle receptor
MAVSFFQKIKESLSRTRERLIRELDAAVPLGVEIDEDALERVEEALFAADLGAAAADAVTNAIRDKIGVIHRRETTVFEVMRARLLDIFRGHAGDGGLRIGEARPYVILVIGVNGAGKTTTIGKLALRYRKENKRVLLAACDTFRAAAIEQLEVWAGRADAEFIRAALDSDAASVAHDAVNRAVARGTDVVLVDTAGRLHTSRNLMEELRKIRNVIEKALPGAPHEILLVLDATTGQNALSQAEQFHRELAVTGIALTKLDGTAKGGIVVSIVDRLNIPIKLIGIGEGIDDLRDFDAEAYVSALLGHDEQRA